MKDKIRQFLLSLKYWCDWILNLIKLKKNKPVKPAKPVAK